VNEFDKELKRRLEDIRSQGLLRELREVDSAQGTRVKIDGKSLLNFSSND
jgi:7-keto-8-aminopelargonate synthetase-like enzyme